MLHTWTRIWEQNWVVHAQQAGTGQKVLDYLDRYVRHIAIAYYSLKNRATRHH